MRRVALALMVPGIAWSVQGTVVSVGDVLKTVGRPLACGIAAGAVAYAASPLYSPLHPLPRLVVETAVLLITYAVMLLFATGRRSQYLDLLRGLRNLSSTEEKVLAST